MAKLFQTTAAATEVYSEEGVVGAAIKEKVGDFKNAGSEIHGWFQNPHEKKNTIVEQCDDLVVWLHKKEKEHPNLSLEVGSFKTWMKTSETFRWRYYFMMHDNTYNSIMDAIKHEENSKLEKMTDVSFSDRTHVTEMLDNMNKIKDLVAFVEKYKKRCSAVFDAIQSRQKKIKGAPFQVMLLGMGDMESTVKKIVNIAI